MHRAPYINKTILGKENHTRICSEKVMSMQAITEDLWTTQLNFYHVYYMENIFQDHDFRYTRAELTEVKSLLPTTTEVIRMYLRRNEWTSQ